MFATLFSVTLFVALAIQGVFADFSIDTPSLTQVIHLSVNDLLSTDLDLYQISVQVLKSLGRRQALPTTFL
jgi:hypothetical protein